MVLFQRAVGGPRATCLRSISAVPTPCNVGEIVGVELLGPRADDHDVLENAGRVERGDELPKRLVAGKIIRHSANALSI